MWKFIVSLMFLWVLFFPVLAYSQDCPSCDSLLVLPSYYPGDTIDIGARCNRMGSVSFNFGNTSAEWMVVSSGSATSGFSPYVSSNHGLAGQYTGILNIGWNFPTAGLHTGSIWLEHYAFCESWTLCDTAWFGVKVRICREYSTPEAPDVSSMCGYLHISWELAPLAAGYRLVRNGVDTLEVVETGYDDYDVDPDTDYSYTLTVLGAPGCEDSPESSPSEPVRVDVPITESPDMPTLDYVDWCTAHLHWEELSNAKVYELRRNTRSDTLTACVVYRGSENSFVDEGLAPTTTYYYWVKGSNSCGETPFSEPLAVMTLSVEETLPERQDISIYPNPFNSSVKILVKNPTGGDVKVIVRNIFGEVIAFPFSGRLPAGSTTLFWAPENLPSGLYLVQVQLGERGFVRRAVLLR